MKIETVHSIGEVYRDDEPLVIKGIHLYISDEGTVTERLYFGKGRWKTLRIHRSKRRRKSDETMEN